MSTNTTGTGVLSLISSEKKFLLERSEKIQAKWRKCRICPFACYRKNVVFGKGSLDSGIVLIGEACGKEEDTLGIPFVGKAGNILNAALEKAGLCYKPDDNPNCLIVNALACRPCDYENGPNRTPTGTEIGNCQPRLQAILKKVAKPSLVILLGNSAAEAVYGYSQAPKKRIVNGRITILKTFHPMAIVYDKTREDSWNEFWECLKSKIKKHIGKRVQNSWPTLPV